MPRDFLPAIFHTPGKRYEAADQSKASQNMDCLQIQNGEVGFYPRNELTAVSATNPSASTDRGRGVVSFGGEFDLYCDESTFYYDGGSQDLTATTGAGYAGNTGFNEEYTASFVRHIISGAPDALVIVSAGHTSTNASANHGNIWWTGDASAAPASISDADLPCNNGVSITRGGASLDGFFFVCDINGAIYNSDLNDITSWTGDQITAQREPDIGVYLGKHHDHLVYIGTRSIEFFYNAGNASGSPLAVSKEIAYRVGCYFPNSIAEFGDEIYFLGTNHKGLCQVYRLRNFQLEVLSSPEVDEKIRNDALPSGTYPDISTLDSLIHECWGAIIQHAKNLHYILTNDFYWTYTYNMNVGIWLPWSIEDDPTYRGGTSGAWNNCFPVIDGNGHTGAGSVSRIQLTNQQVAYFGSADNDALDDLGLANDPDIWLRFPRWDGGTDRKKKVTSVRIITRPWANSTLVDPINATLNWAKFETAQTISPPSTGYTASRTVDLNKRGAKVPSIGVGREFSFAVVLTAGHGEITMITGLEIEYEVVGQ